MRKPLKLYVFFLALTLVLSLGLSEVVLAADVILNDLQSKPANISAVTGKPSILFFWTTWCPYCRSELKELNRMRAQIEKDGVDIFAVNVGEEGAKVGDFINKYALNMRVLLDRDGRAAQNYAVRGVPTYIFINRYGQVTATEHRLPDNYMDILSQ